MPNDNLTEAYNTIEWFIGTYGRAYMYKFMCVRVHTVYVVRYMLIARADGRSSMCRLRLSSMFTNAYGGRQQSSWLCH